MAGYRGRLAPSPTGYLHLGHAGTFRTAWNRAHVCAGTLVLRVEDLDRARCKPEYAAALAEDMRWIGLRWQEGPDVGGPYGPYRQSERGVCYLEAWRTLAEKGAIYACACTRRNVKDAIRAPHDGEHEPIYSGCCRPGTALPIQASEPGSVNWRFRTTPDETITFIDGAAGPQTFSVGRDFGDFIIWRKDGVPAYQLAVVVDDAAMRITEIVRGADLLPSTAQQLLVYRALALVPPAFYHCPLVTDADGRRLSKRGGAHSLRALRAAGVDPASLFDA